MSSDQDRLTVIYEAYQAARMNKVPDLKAATTNAEVDAILANLDKLHASYLEAIDANLKATGADIEAAYEAAKAANKAVTDARKHAQHIPDLINKTAALADKIGGLLKAVTA